MVQNPYYPTEAQQAEALTEYDKQVDHILDVLDALSENGMPLKTYNTLVTEVKQLKFMMKGNTMKYDVTIPSGKVDKTTDNRGRVVGIPSFNEAEKYIGLNDEELQKIISSFVTDTATGELIVIERVYR